MKKILCPVDFSEASESGMEYAGYLGRIIPAHVTLFYVRLSIWPEAVQLEREVNANTEKISEQLMVSSSAVQKEFGVSCNFEIESTTETPETAIAAKALAYDLIVLGTNGADDLYQHLFGSNTFRIIEQ